MRPAVLITGASSGIGYATALHLARLGTTVIAGILRQHEGAQLLREGGGHIRPVLLDVTDRGALERVRAMLESSPQLRLAGVVNNAGIALAGPLEALTLDDLHRQFDVNFFGVMSVTQTFLPLLRRARGRIVNVSSIDGKLAAPFAGAYSASKFALEAASDALRIELQPFGVKVCVIESGAVKTPIRLGADDAGLRRLDQMPRDVRLAYDAAFRSALDGARARAEHGLPPERIARTIERALFSRRPKARYIVGAAAWRSLLFARLPDPLRDALVLAALASAARGNDAVPAVRAYR